ncbi:MAG: hypothetical protein B9S32_13880 [Verrucomicrobia bacterium Tous-C9LFEB]|nr:MAG: hypothetical protein B9S32_13880 [Verrucomicrobia bacterium Tous-C9LFEB]
MNAASVQSFNALALATLSDVWGEPIILGSVEGRGMLTVLSLDEVMQEAGSQDLRQGKLHVRQSDYPTPPATGTIVTARALQWRTEECRDDRYARQWIIPLREVA